MVRMHAQHRPAYVASLPVPILPMAGLGILLVIAGLLLYFWSDPRETTRGGVDPPGEVEIISFTPPTFVFEDGQPGQIHFSADPRW